MSRIRLMCLHLTLHLTRYLHLTMHLTELDKIELEFFALPLEEQRLTFRKLMMASLELRDSVLSSVGPEKSTTPTNGNT
jgi:hypothetical protein